MVADLERRSEKKKSFEGKTPYFLSNVVSPSAKNIKNKLHPEVMPHALLSKRRQSNWSKGTALYTGKPSHRHCSLPGSMKAVTTAASFIALYNLQTTLTPLRWVQKQVKKTGKTNPCILFPTYRQCSSREQNKTLLSYATKSQILMQSSIFCTSIVSGPNFNIHLLLTDVHV